MKKKTLYTLIAISVILGIFLSIIMLFNETTEGFLKNLFEFIGVLQAIASFYIAYLLYDRFGTSMKLLDKQNEVILEYIEELKKLRFFIYLVHDTTLTQVQISMRRKLKEQFKEEVLNRKVMVSSDFGFTETKRLNELIEHPLFPADLKQKIDVFRFRHKTGDFNFDSTKYAFVSYTPIVDFKSFNQNEWMFPNEGDMQLKNYVESLEKAIHEIEEWINRESTLKISLNIE